MFQLSQEFAKDPQQEHNLRQELQNYLSQNIALEDSVAKLKNSEDKDKVLRISYEIICSNGINEREVS